MNQQDERLLPRRSPRQLRGQQRVSSILDAAEALFAEIGYEATTTNQIAAHAHIPIGSIYQFFPNKGAILHAVAARYSADFDARYAATFAVPGATLSTNAAMLVMAMVEFGLERQGFTRIILFSANDPELMEAAAAARENIKVHLESMIQRAAPTLPATRSQLLAHAGIVATKAVLGAAIMAHEHDQAYAKALVHEAQAMLASYLERGVASSYGA